MLKPADRTRSVVGNSLAAVLAQTGGIGVSLVLTPFILSTLGIQRYGLWVFVASIVAYAGLLEFGIGRSSVRYIAFYSERNEFDVVRKIISYGILWHVVAALFLIPSAWLAARVVLPHTHLSPELRGTAELLFPLVLAYYFLTAAIRPLGALLTGLERMWITSFLTLLSQLVYGVFAVLLLAEGFGIFGLVTASFVGAISLGSMLYLAGRRLIGPVLGNPFAIGRPLLKDMLRFGGWMQVSNLASILNSQTDAVVIGTYVRLTSVTLYDIGNKIAQLTRFLPLAFLGPMLPAAASMHARGMREGIGRVYLQGSRFLGLLSIGMTGFVIATSPLLMTVWLGKSYKGVSTVVILLCIAYVVNNLTGVGTTMVLAIGRPRLESEYGVLGMLLNIAGTVALAPFYGLYGVLAGTVIGVTLSSVYFLWRFHRVAGLSLSHYTGTWLWRLCVAGVVSTGAIWAIRVSVSTATVSGRTKGGVMLIMLGLMYGMLYVASLHALRFFDEQDLTLLRRVLPKKMKRLASVRAVEYLFGVRK